MISHHCLRDARCLTLNKSHEELLIVAARLPLDPTYKISAVFRFVFPANLLHMRAVPVGPNGTLDKECILKIKC